MNLTVVFDQFPQLQTERLVLREITTADREAVYNVFRTAEVVRYYDVKQFKAIEEADNIIEHFQQKYNKRRAVRWGIALRENPAWLIGSCGYNVLDPFAYFGEIGYELHPAYWRQGLMTEAVAALLRFGFEEVGLYRIEANLFKGNLASAGVLTKLGFQLEGTLRERELWNGERFDLEWYGLLREDYDSRKLSK